VFDAQSPVADTRVPDAVAALNKSFGEAAMRLVESIASVI
jgi:ABC-type uncharacterized transport system auxiliary subunit